MSSYEADNQLHKQLHQLKLDLAEVIDEVVFAENAQKKAENDLEDFRLQSIHQETSLVRCIESLTQYLHLLERDVLLPAIGSFVVSLADHYDITKKRSSAIQSVENIVASHPAVTSGDALLANLEPPTVTTSTSARRQQVSSMRKKPWKVDDVYVMAGTLTETFSRAHALSASSLRMMEEYHELATLRRKSFENVDKKDYNETVSFLKEEIQFLRQTVSAQQQRLSGNVNVGSVTDETHRLREELAKEREHGAKRFQASSDRMESLLQNIRDLENKIKEYEARELNGSCHKSLDSASSREVLALQSRVHEVENELQKKYQENIALGEKVAQVEKIFNERRHRVDQQNYEDTGMNATDKTFMVKLLQSEIVELRTELRESRHDSDETIRRLKKRNDKLQKQMTELSINRVAEGLNLGEDAANHQRDYVAKIKAFEMTVQSLNNELVQFEERLQHNDRRCEEEVALVKHDLHLRQKEYSAEREEYEAIVNRITTELEQLMKENIQLKQRLRQAFGTSPQRN
eukprot:Tbor_TRINITY_DN3512_c0_g1::TRINITY_DN3512_c0_g1_i1::g.2903::m.2903